MKKRKSSVTARGAARRAQDLADIARTLDERKSALAYGEFERWALRTYPRYPIQVLRYLRKAHRTFGKELPRLLERFGQKKVFLLVGLDDPWTPIKDGISTDGARESLPLEQLSVTQMREAIRRRNSSESRTRDAWGPLTASLGRITTLWPRVQKHPPVATLRRDGARKQLERFRALVSDVLGQVDAVLASAARTATGTERGTRRPARAVARPAARNGRDSTFLD